MTGLISRMLPVIEPSIVPPTEQERTRLLLELKQAHDFYALEFAMAEYAGYVRGLFFSLQISPSQLILFQLEASRVWDCSANRFLKVVA